MNRRHLFGAKNRRSYLLRRLRCSFEQLSERRLLAVDDGMLFQAIDPQWFQAGEHINRLRSMPQRNSSNLEEGTSDHSGSVYGPVELTYGEWIVQLSTTALATIQTPADAPRLLAAPGIEFQLIQGLGKPGLVLLQSKASSTEEVAQLLRLNALVEYATPNGLVDSARLPDDTRFSSMTNLLNVGQLGTAVDADVDAELAWDFTVGSPQVVVGIVDSGIDVTHPDLYLNVWINQGEIPTGKRNLLQDSDADGLFTFYDLNQASNQSLVRDLNGNTYIDALDLLSDPQWSDGLDTDGNGFIDDFFGWNFRAGANEPFAANNPMDNFGHGTHVAGTVGAVGNNAIGVTGINWRTSLMSLKFLDENNQGDTAAAIAAINYATMMRSEFDVNVRVLNNSWGQPSGANAALAAAIEESGDAGILFVAAAGNGNILGNGIDNDRSPFYPASYSLSNVISVAASDGQDRLAAFSNFGASSVDLVAPGVGVLSTLPGKRYGTANGTSMSTPHVTGSAALIWSRLPNALVSEVRAALLTGVDPIAELTGKIASGGRLNLAKSLQANVFSVQARVTSASNIVTAGGVDNQVEVEYFHPDGIDLATIDSGDLIVTRDWGADHKVLSQLINGSIVSSADDRTVKARYRVLAPGGTWDTLDFGTYRISLSVGAVNSKQGRTSNTAAFGSFLVRINDPSVFYVNTTVDSVDQTIGNGQAIDANGRTSLRAAIQEANASGSAKTLILDDGRYLLSQAGRGEDLAVTGDLDVRVPISIYANQRSTTEIDANFLDRAFDVQATGQLTLARVAIKKGQPLATENGGVVRAIGNVLLDDVLISDGKAIQGGGVFVDGNATATVRSSSINSNTANDAGGAIAVLGCGQLTLDRSTIAFNIATSPTSRGGAGILIDNQVCSVQPQNTVVNSTISTNGNDRFSVGGLYMNSGRLTVDHSTIAKNIGTGIEFFDTSFGATNGTGVLSFSIANSIVIENRGIGLRNDFYLPMGFASAGYNVLGVGSGGVAGNDILSLFAQPLTNIIDSLSEDAQGNLIHPLLPNSRAIDAADPLSPVTIDQLGNARGADGNGRFIANQPYEPDIGAVEAVAARIAGIVFADVDGDGVRDPSESGLVGRVVFLDDNNSGLLDSTEISTRTVADDPTTLTVNEAGSYEFSGVVPGRRVVRIAQVDGWQHRLSGSDELVSRTATGQEPSGSADLPQVSQQGRLILFESDATDLVSGPENDQFIFDSYLKTVQALPMPAGIVGSPRTVISDSGNIIVFQTDISLTVLDRATGIFGSFEESTGIQPNAPFVLGDVSADGRYVVFSSAATNLVGTDPRLTVDVNGFADVFWWDRQNGIVRNLSLANNGLQANAESIGPIISSDGMRVAFLSSATNLIANDNNQATDYFLYDLSSDQILRISPAVPGNGIGDSFEGAINGNGDYVIFRAFVGTGLDSHVYLYSRTANSIRQVTQVPSLNRNTTISDDGRYTALDDDDNLRVFDLVTGDVKELFPRRLLSETSLQADISADGQMIAYRIDASNNAFNRVVRLATNPFLATESRALNLFASDRVNDVSFSAEALPGSIAGVVYNDLGVNNVFDLGDNGLSNVTVYLDLNGNQVKDEVEPATVSDASGVYRFDNLKTERNYKVRLILPQGLEFSSPELANLEVFVFAGQTVPNVDFALATAITEGQSQEGIIRGRVFQDLNGNGTFDDGAGSLLAGKTVFLDQNGDGKWQHPERRVETDAQGNFSIEKLGTQIATVVVETDVGTVQTSPMGSRFTRFDQPLFNTASSFTNPQAIVTGDFNKDTFPDVAVALLAGNQVSIRFGDGKGGFTSAKVDVAVPGSGPIAMYAGYFNAGPDLDLAVVNNFDGQVTIMRDFNGTGFSSIANVKVGEEPLDIAAGNFNGDSAVDLAVVNKAGNTISVLMNDGLGGFTLASTISSGGRVPTAIVPGQFTDDNNDGLINALDSLDLAAINAFPQGVGNNGVVALLRGNGAGGFSLASTVGVGGAPTDAVVADLDLDGFQDLAVTNSTDNSVSILLGRVGGTFQLQTEKLGTAEGTLDIVALDLEQDGDIDLVTGNVKDRNVTIFRNTRLQSAPGSVLRFEPGQNVGVGENQVAERLPLVVEDFDKSGSKDLLVAKGASQSIAVLSNSPIKGSHRVSVSGTETIVGLNFGLANAVLVPALDPISNPPELYEDAAADVIPLTGIARGRAGGPALQITATTSSPELIQIPADAIAYVQGEDKGSLRITPAKDATGTAVIMVSVRDAGFDQLLQTADDAVTTRSFTVTIRPINDAPAFSLPANRVVSRNEDSGAIAIDGFASVVSVGGSGFETNQKLLPFIVTADQPALFAVQPQIDAQGRLTFTPASNRNGTTSVSVTLKDDGGIANGGIDTRTENFVIALTPLNDPPSFEIVGNVAARVNAGAQVVPSFASAFQPGGGPDEVIQSAAEYLISVDRSELFLVLPSIDRLGTLRFTPSGSAGNSAVRVQVRDSGGTAGGGQDLSVEKTFTIQITAEPDNTSPNPQLTATVPGVTNASAFDVEIRFGEPVSGFVLTDLSVTNGVPSNLRDLGGGTFNVTITPGVDGPLTVLVPGNVVTDLAGNANSAGTALSRNIDKTPPQPQLIRVTPNPTTSLVVDVSLDFGEAVTGLTTDDLVLFNSSVETLQDLGNGKYTLKLRAQNAGLMIIGLSNSAASDSATNASGQVIPLVYTIEAAETTGPLVLSTTTTPQGVVQLVSGRVVVRNNGVELMSRTASLVTKVEIVDAGAQTVGSIANPATTLVNASLEFATQAGHVSTTLLVGAGTFDLGQSPATGLNGIDELDLTQAGITTLVATANDLVRLNGGELVRIVCGAEDRLQLGTGFSLVSSSAEGSRFIPRFVSGNASIEVVHDPMWSNPFDNADVNGDGLVAPQDALAVINVLNSGRVSMPNSQFLSPSQLSSDQFRFYDVNGDNQLTPADALVVINRLNRVTSAREPTQSVWIDVESPNGRRRRSGDLPSEIVDELFDIEGGSF